MNAWFIQPHKDNFLSITRTLVLELDSHALRNLAGEYNKHIKYLQERLEIQITQRQNNFILTGE